MTELKNKYISISPKKFKCMVLRACEMNTFLMLRNSFDLSTAFGAGLTSTGGLSTTIILPQAQGLSSCGS